MWRRSTASAVALLLALAAGACTGEGSGEVAHVRIPRGASFAQITDSLAAHDVVQAPFFFRLYARASGADRAVQPGTYGFRRQVGWDRVLGDLRLGRFLTARISIPEGWELRRIAPRLAAVAGTSPDSTFERLANPTEAARFGVPGPTLEGYLYPATYTVPVDLPIDTIVARMVAQYQKIWTPERRARADSIRMNEREVVTLASIVEKEAKVRTEMPLIAAVYHNRLRIGYPLQADPTVQYALGAHQRRLLYAHIDSVADNPYNTYRRRGLPPGPIASPSVHAVDAVLYPAAADFLYFVARTDGSHIFTRSLEEHNRAKAMLRRERQAAEARQTSDAQPTSEGRAR